MPRTNDLALARQRWKWMMIGFAIAGVTTIAIGFMVVRADGDAWDRAMAEQGYVGGTCVVESVDVSEMRRTEDDRTTRVTVTMTVHASSGDRSGVEYVYPDYFWNPTSAAQALQGQLARGAEVGCAYSPTDPSRAVVMRRTRPEGPRPGLSSAWLGFLLGGIFLFPPIVELLLPKSVKAKRKFESTDT